jgi:hypothetical protein
MKATLLGMGVLLLAAGMSAQARAQEPVTSYPMYQPVRPLAQDLSGPGHHTANQGGVAYGPNYCGYPGSAPYGGVGLQWFNGGPQGCGGGPQFPMHRFSRSPRDFFMMGD